MLYTFLTLDVYCVYMYVREGMVVMSGCYTPSLHYMCTVYMYVREGMVVTSGCYTPSLH